MSSSFPQTQGTSQASRSSNGELQGSLNEQVLKDLVLSITRCNSVGELIRLVPVPVQPISRDLFEEVYQASQKLGTATALSKLWKDKLRIRKFDEVAQLNSLRTPVVQVSKEALAADDGMLSSLNLDQILLTAKENALTQMILIKDAEVQALTDFVQSTAIASRLHRSWGAILSSQASLITPEHGAILREPEVLRRFSQTVASIGESSFERVRLVKEKRTQMKKNAQIDKTDIAGDSKKQLTVLVEEALRRRDQSRKDRTLSGKGKGSSKVSKVNKKTLKQQQKKKALVQRKQNTKASGKPPKKR